MLNRNHITGVLAALALGACGTGDVADPDSGDTSTPEAGPVIETGKTAGFSGERNAYFGDLHIHTRSSFDAYIFGVRGSADDAYRFAKGEEVISSTGQRTRLVRPLDFLIVSDHAEALGLAPYIADANPDLLATRPQP